MKSVLPLSSELKLSRLYGFSVVALVLLTCFLFGLSFYLEPQTRALLMKENGVIENLTVVGYLLCVFTMLLKGGAAYLKKYWYFATVLLAFAARELDFDKRFTNFGVLKSKFLVHPDVSWWGKVIAMAIVLFILLALITIVRRHGRTFLAEVFDFDWSVKTWSIGFAGGFLVLSKSIDGLGRKLSDWGISQISDQADLIASMAEESMEFTVPFFFLLTILYYFNCQKGSR